MFVKINFIKLVLIALILAVLPGCSIVQGISESVNDLAAGFLGGKDNSEPPNELVEYEPELSIKILWKEQIGIGYGEQNVKLLPAIIAGTIFAADREGLVEARNINSGDLIWEQETGLELSGGIGQGVDTLFIGSSDGEVVSMNAATGEINWATEVSSEVLAKPVVGLGHVIVRTGDGKIAALDEATGLSIWSFERSVPALSIRGTGVPVIVSDSVIAGYANGKLIALEISNGKKIWESSIAIPRGRSEIERLVDLDTDPIEVDDVIYIASYQGGVSAVLAIDGDVLWTNEDVSAYSGLSSDWRYIYLSDSESDVWQLDQNSSGSLWKQEELHQRRLTAPVVYQDYVVVGDFEGYVHWLADDDGRQLGRTQVSDSAILAPPIVENDIIYIYASDGTLAALKVIASE